MKQYYHDLDNNHSPIGVETYGQIKTVMGYPGQHAPLLQAFIMRKDATTSREDHIPR